jgi:hypothetical protein
VHGSITPEILIRQVSGYHATGDANVVVMDPASGKIWVSYSEYGSSGINAYKRSAFEIDLNDYW